MIRGLLLLAFIGLLSPCLPQSSPESRFRDLADSLSHRLKQIADSLPALPAVSYRHDLVANARYESGHILVGSFQADYHSFGDSLSILYHEYIHALHERRGEFVICLDSLGQIPQWTTDHMYSYTPDKEEVSRDLSQALGPWLDHYEEAHREKEIERLKRDLSRPRKMVFVYAPSLLAEAEINAYQEQLAGENLGLYRLSSEAKSAIQRRIRQLEDTHKRRQRYEKQYQLSPDGCPTD